MPKRKNKLPVFSQMDVSPKVVGNDVIANLSDQFDMEVNSIKITVAIKDLENISKLGEGQFGLVDKMRHVSSDLIFAVKKIRCSMDEKEQSRLLNDISISKHGTQCPYLVLGYGAMFQGGDVWICMEVLATSLDKFYMKMPEGELISECLLAYITFSIVTALEFLHREMSVIHRDVKPSNVLLDFDGRVKVCDFGISGLLINSLVDTHVGTQPYLAPERINPDRSSKEYGIRSDVWSLGLSILEVAIRRFPYRNWGSLIDQLRDVVSDEAAPSLPEDSPYSATARMFISCCLVKKVTERAKYDQLLRHKWLKKLHNDVDGRLTDAKASMAAYVNKVLAYS